MTKLNNKIKRLLDNLPDKVDAILITSDVHRKYFTGFSSSAGTIFAIKNEEAYFIIDFRYYEKAKNEIDGCKVLLQERLFNQLNNLIKQHHVKNISIESEYMTVADFHHYQQNLPETTLTMNKQVDEHMRSMRMIKTNEELTNIKKAQQITDDAFEHICSYIQPNMTEKDIAGELLDFTYRNGSERPSFDFIVVSGMKSSMPHGVPTNKKVAVGDFITMDFGCVVNGYCSDMTRTVAVHEINDKQKMIYNTVLKAQLSAIQAVKPGMLCQNVDKAARDVIQQAGYGQCFGHSTGHSVGLEIHERPAFSPMDKTVCQSGMVITVEPGIYLAGQFGVRIEDMVCVTNNGCEILTKSPKELIIV